MARTPRKTTKETEETVDTTITPDATVDETESTETEAPMVLTPVKDIKVKRRITLNQDLVAGLRNAFEVAGNTEDGDAYHVASGSDEAEVRRLTTAYASSTATAAKPRGGFRALATVKPDPDAEIVDEDKGTVSNYLGYVVAIAVADEAAE